MNWFKENKGLAALLGVILLLAFALCYLLFSEKSKHDAALETYSSRVASLAQLRSLAPFRNQENLKNLQAQQAEFSKAISNLRVSLVNKQGEIKPVDPAAFQNRLRAAVTATISRAKTKGVALPEKFFLGFDKYDASLPANEIAGVLDWQLTVIEKLVESIIDLKVAFIGDIVRVPVPGEEGSAPANLPPEPQYAAGVRPEKEPSAGPLLVKYPFEISVKGYQNSIQTILNQLLTTDQFLVVRAIRVENEQLNGPLRGGAAEVGGATPPIEAPSQPGTAAAAKIIVGSEQVDATLIIDLVYFTPAPNAEVSPTPAQ
ncbi:MAG TPA: Amuc_1100 family pilus-like protein [Chthoniobacterales bacterium]